MILTNDEIAALQHLGGGIAPRAVEAAVLAKLAAGVSVEPVATVQTRHMQALGAACGVEAHLHHYQPPGTLLYTATAIAIAHAAGRKSVHDSCVDLWKEEVIAEARVAAINECANLCDDKAVTKRLFVNESHYLECRDSIRALIGKEST